MEVMYIAYVYLPVLTCSSVIVWKASNKSHVYTIINCTSNIMYNVWVCVCVCYRFNAFTICMVSAHCSEIMPSYIYTHIHKHIWTVENNNNAETVAFSKVRKITIKISIGCLENCVDRVQLELSTETLSFLLFRFEEKKTTISAWVVIILEHSKCEGAFDRKQKLFTHTSSKALSQNWVFDLDEFCLPFDTYLKMHSKIREWNILYLP